MKDNILFGENYDEERYKDCLDACELLEDIKHMKGGDHYSIPNLHIFIYVI